MSTQLQIVTASQRLARAQDSLARERLKKRKADTRRKIEFGGWVIKAKMDSYPKDIILGALLQAAQQLETQEGAFSLLKSKGERAFMGFEKEC